ncbi:MAG: DUF3592 domain-containing protein [Polyangiaceae bacterium]
MHEVALREPKFDAGMLVAIVALMAVFAVSWSLLARQYEQRRRRLVARWERAFDPDRQPPLALGAAVDLLGTLTAPAIEVSLHERLRRRRRSETWEEDRCETRIRDFGLRVRRELGGANVDETLEVSARTTPSRTYPDAERAIVLNAPLDVFECVERGGLRSQSYSLGRGDQVVISGVLEAGEALQRDSTYRVVNKELRLAPPPGGALTVTDRRSLAALQRSSAQRWALSLGALVWICFLAGAAHAALYTYAGVTVEARVTRVYVATNERGRPTTEIATISYRDERGDTHSLERSIDHFQRPPEVGAATRVRYFPGLPEDAELDLRGAFANLAQFLLLIAGFCAWLPAMLLLRTLNVAEPSRLFVESANAA